MGFWLCCATCAGMALDERADIWALGCVIYSLAYLKHPFPEAGSAAIVSARYRIPHTPTRPADLTTLIRACMARKPEHRPTSESIASFCRAHLPGAEAPADMLSLLRTKEGAGAVELNPDCQKGPDAPRPTAGDADGDGMDDEAAANAIAEQRRARQAANSARGTRGSAAAGGAGTDGLAAQMEKMGLKAAPAAAGASTSSALQQRLAKRAGGAPSAPASAPTPAPAPAPSPSRAPVTPAAAPAAAAAAVSDDSDWDDFGSAPAASGPATTHQPAVANRKPSLGNDDMDFDFSSAPAPAAASTGDDFFDSAPAPAPAPAAAAASARGAASPGLGPLGRSPVAPARLGSPSAVPSRTISDPFDDFDSEAPAPAPAPASASAATSRVTAKSATSPSGFAVGPSDDDFAGLDFSGSQPAKPAIPPAVRAALDGAGGFAGSRAGGLPLPMGLHAAATVHHPRPGPAVGLGTWPAAPVASAPVPAPAPRGAPTPRSTLDELDPFA